MRSLAFTDWLTTDKRRRVAGALYVLRRAQVAGGILLADGLLHTGQRADGFGLMDYRARFYSPYLNRFVQPDTIVPDPSKSSDFDRYAYSANNPVKYKDPIGHRSCTDEQAATGDETCDQNLSTNDLEHLLTFLYEWDVNGDWSKEQLLTMLDAGKAISRYVYSLSGANGNTWIRKYLGGTTFDHADLIEKWLDAFGTVRWKSTVRLIDDFSVGNVVHELGHVLDNRFKAGGLWPATYKGGGAATAMLEAVGGHPEDWDAWRPMFVGDPDYLVDIAGDDPWPRHMNGSKNIADDFADTFMVAVLKPDMANASQTRLMWMNAFISVSASILP